MSVDDYIKRKTGGLTQRLLFNRIVVYVQDALPDRVDLGVVLRTLEDRIPDYLADVIDSIYIGKFSFLDERDLDAVYDSGAIYVTNIQEDNQDLLTDIVHEMSHAVEEVYPLEIYGDGSIESEFSAKRRTMGDTLHAHGFTKIGKPEFAEMEYSPRFDSYLYQDVGYDTIANLLNGLFVSPYGATSLKEYYANGFEEFFTGDAEYLRKVSPAVYKKMLDLVSAAEG